MVRKTRRDEDDEKQNGRADNNELFLEASEKIVKSCDLLEELAPYAARMDAEDSLLLLSLSLALDAELRSMRNRYGVIRRKE